MAPYLRLLRPHQWIKNTLCFAGLVFSKQLFSDAVIDAAGTFFAFIAVSSAVYVVNDIVDRERDRQHPKKKHRPVASGEVSVGPAIVLAVLLAAGGLLGSYAISIYVFLCLLAYLLNNAAYSYLLKHMVLLDVLSISFGFVLRLLSGIYAVGKPPTSWILVCTFFLALFLALSKRRSELASVPEDSPSRRPVLSEYSLATLDDMLSNAAIMAVLSYALYTISNEASRLLVATVPIVYYTIASYKIKILEDGLGQNTVGIVTKNRNILVGTLLWASSYILIVY